MTVFKIFPLYSRTFGLNWFDIKNLFDSLNVTFGFKRLKVHSCAISKRSFQLGKKESHECHLIWEQLILEKDSTQFAKLSVIYAEKWSIKGTFFVFFLKW